MALGTNPKKITKFTRPVPPDIKKPVLGARFNSIKEARVALKGKSLGTLPKEVKEKEKKEIVPVEVTSEVETIEQVGQDLSPVETTETPETPETTEDSNNTEPSEAIPSESVEVAPEVEETEAPLAQDGDNDPAPPKNPAPVRRRR